MQGKHDNVAPQVALIYIGDGTFIHGVPARNLTAAEAEQYADIITEQRRLTGVALYHPARPAKQDGEVANG